VLCVLVAGCGFTPSRARATVDGAAIDAPTPTSDVPRGAPDGPSICYGAGMETVCLDAAPTTAYPGGDLAVLTDVGGPLCRTDVTTPSDGSLCVVAFTDVMLTGTLSGSGARPLVVIAANTFTVTSTGVIDVASHASGTPQSLGAAANGPCSPATASAAHGGGAGGSFGGTGGVGGSLLGPAGTPGNPISPTALRGGCVGLDGTGTPGNHGDGGGAVALLAGTLQIDGQVNASGDGAHGGSGNGYGGGGGGGSGGLIAIVATMLSGSGQIYAAGGGGAEGGEDDGTATTGGPGGDPSKSTLGGGAAGGGGRTENAGNGGGGNTSSATVGGNGQTGTPGDMVGGGGGGGAAGYILLHVGGNSFTGPGAYSPQPTNI